MIAAGGYPLATLCIKAVVDDERNKPNARRRNPCDKQPSTAATWKYKESRNFKWLINFGTSNVHGLIFFHNVKLRINVRV